MLAETVGVDVENAGVGTACKIVACDVGLGELACGEICDLDIEWSCWLKGCIPEGERDIVNVVN